MLFEKTVLSRYRAATFCRYDDMGVARYFGPEDFPGLKAEPVSFQNKYGDPLAGWFYSYEDPQKDRIVVFDHGIGGGHRSYMKEIALLAKEGFRVFAYDHAGCMASGGDGARGLSGSLADLDYAIVYLNEARKIRDGQISVVGHSWGGFAALNISRYHPFLSHVVVISGYLSLPRIAESRIPGLLKPFAKTLVHPILELERETNPGYADSDALSSLAGSGAKTLLIYSDNDPLIQKALHYDPLYEAFAEREGFTFLLEKGKFHNPNYTREAAAYLSEFTGDLTKKARRGLLKTEAQREEFRSSWDWDRMTEQDPAVWDVIFRHLAG